MTQPSEHEIPILTDIIQPGDADKSRPVDSAAAKTGIPAERIEQLVIELLDEMLPKFKQQLIARLLEKLKA